MKRKRFRLCIIGLVSILLSVVVCFGVPAFAQTQVATLIPGQPLSQIAANQIISHSGLPTEVLPDGTTNAMTRGRDAVNAYRHAHNQLYVNGWYRGISEDHTPLLVAVVKLMEKEGYTSAELEFEQKKTEILGKFWLDSDTQNVRRFGFDSLEDFYDRIESLEVVGRTTEASQLMGWYGEMWK